MYTLDQIRDYSSKCGVSATRALNCLIAYSAAYGKRDEVRAYQKMLKDV